MVRTSPDALAHLDQRRVARVLRRQARLVVLFLLLGLLGGATYASLRDVTYSSSSTVLLGDPVTLLSLTPGPASSSTPRSASAVAASQLGRLSGGDVAAEAERRLAGRARHEMSFVPSTTDPSTVVVTATSPDAATAREAATAYAQAYLAGVAAESKSVLTATASQLEDDIEALSDQVTTLEKTLASTPTEDLPTVQAVVGPVRDDVITRRGVLQRQLDQVKLVETVSGTGNARLLAPADAPRPTTSQTTVVLLGGLLGLLIGLLVVALREARAGTVHDEEDVRLTGLDVGRVLELPVQDVRVPRVLEDDVVDPDTDARLRVLANTFVAAPGSGGAVFLFASADRERLDTGVLVARVAARIAASGRRVAVVCADPSADQVESVLGVPGHAGLSDVLHGDVALRDLLQAQPSLLRVLPAGRRRGGVPLSGPAFDRVLDELVDSDHLVLVLGPPLGATSEALLLLPAADGCVLVARRGRTRRRELEALQRTLLAQPDEEAVRQRSVLVLHGLGRGRELRLPRRRTTPTPDHVLGPRPAAPALAQRP